MCETENTMDKCENQIASPDGKILPFAVPFFATTEIPAEHETCFHAQLFVWKSIGGLTVSCNSRVSCSGENSDLDIDTQRERERERESTAQRRQNSSIKWSIIAMNCLSLNC